MTPTLRFILLAAATLGFSGIALGAFGAHALKETLTARSHTSTWQTAVLYHLIHAVALLALAGVAATWPNARAIAWCWVLGTLFFSGSLYWLSLGGPKILGPVTPIGGLLFLVGWALIAWSALQQTKA
ncbi:DUF423 domain-containing protein [Oleiharenicola lentus]|uniref:DUF423 domain-containing protein n=1 Tax=Oleiharenicola lentus TaxID=2508720 RepID=UPI003F6774D0